MGIKQETNKSEQKDIQVKPQSAPVVQENQNVLPQAAWNDQKDQRAMAIRRQNMLNQSTKPDLN